jgi:8-oxo-dGTP pyrophosphatase MutT (NUDIX family)
MKNIQPIKGLKKIVHRRHDITEAVHETTSGGVIFRRLDEGFEILLIADMKKRWTIPKGHVDPGEEPRQTAQREIQEETGLQQIKVYSWLGKVNFQYRRLNTLVLMTMHLYLVEITSDSDNFKPEKWLSDIKWFKPEEAINLIEYDDISKLILVGIKKIRLNDL